MRTELGWGVGSKAEKKPLKFFLWEAENWIALVGTSIEPCSGLFLAGHESSAASPPWSLPLSIV